MAKKINPNLRNIVVSDDQFDDELRLITPGRYSMESAIAILEFLEAEMGADIKDTGWKNGFGLEVAVGLPIRFESLSAALLTDGSDIVIQRISGTKGEFDRLCSAIRSLIEA